MGIVRHRWVSVVLAVILSGLLILSLTGESAVLRAAGLRVLAMRSDLVLRPPEPAQGSPEALKTRLVALLEAVPGPARFAIDGCTLSLEVDGGASACAGGDVRGFTERVDLTRLLMHPAHHRAHVAKTDVSEGGPAIAELVLAWTPRSEIRLREELEAYVLSGLDRVKGAERTERLAFAREMSDTVLSGGYGPLAAENHREVRLCDGTVAVEPFHTTLLPLRVPAPRVAELSAVLHGLSRGACPTRGWLID